MRAPVVYSHTEPPPARRGYVHELWQLLAERVAEFWLWWSGEAFVVEVDQKITPLSQHIGIARDEIRDRWPALLSTRRGATDKLTTTVSATLAAMGKGWVTTPEIARRLGIRHDAAGERLHAMERRGLVTSETMAREKSGGRPSRRWRRLVEVRK